MSASQAIWIGSFKNDVHCMLCRVLVIYLVPTIYRYKYYFAWAVAESGLTVSGFNYNGQNERGAFRWDRYVNTRIRHVEFQTSLAKLPEHWNICTGLFLRQCRFATQLPQAQRCIMLLTGLHQNLMHFYYALACMGNPVSFTKFINVY